MEIEVKECNEAECLANIDDSFCTVEKRHITGVTKMIDGFPQWCPMLEEPIMMFKKEDK